MKLISPTTKLNFGKYKGKTLLEIGSVDMPYIEWCLINVKKFAFDDAAYQELKGEFPNFEFSENAETFRIKKMKLHSVDELINEAFKKDPRNNTPD